MPDSPKDPPPIDPRQRLPRALVSLGWRRPRLVLGVWLGLVLIATPAVLHLEVETSTNSVLDRDSREWEYYERSQRLFGGDEILSLLIEGEEPFEPALVAEVIRLSDAFQGIPGVARVDSLRTVPNVRVEADGSLSLEAVLAGETASARITSSTLFERVSRDRLAPRLLVSDDGRALGINLRLEKGSEERYAEILATVENAAARPSWLSGVPVFRVAADERTRKELLTFVPLTIALVGGLLFAIFRSFRATWVPLATTGLGVWLVMGVMGSQGVPVTITTVTLPSILLALGCAYCMHLLNAVATREGGVEEALHTVALPVMLSGLTTAVGFVAMSLVRIDAIRDIGTYGALGVLVIVLATLTAAPAVMSLHEPPRLAPHFRQLLGERGPAFLLRLVLRRRVAVLSVWALLAILTVAGVGRLRVETDVIVWFPKDDPIRIGYEAIKQRLVGISPMNVVIEATGESPVSDPDAIDAVDRLARHLEALGEVGRAISIADPLRQMHGGFIEDSGQPLPREAALIEQYLLLLEAKRYTNDLITLDRSAANVVLRVNDNGSQALLDVARRAEGWWDEHGPPGFTARTTGIMFEFARAEDEIAWGQVRGLGLALAAIAVILLVMFRLPRLAVVALIPNALPVAMMFGTMGLLGFPIDAATVILGSLALGIAVDDTIHLSEGFARRINAGSEPSAALAGTLAQVLAPLSYTTLAVAMGFVALTISGFLPISNLGAITAGVMVVCLAADVTLLPSLLLAKGVSGRQKAS